MSFYNLNREERLQVVEKINQDIENDLKESNNEIITTYFSDQETYNRKIDYLTIDKVFYVKYQLQSIFFFNLKSAFFSLKMN